MKLPDNEFNEPSLTRLGEEVSSLLKKNDFEALARRFGYALAFDREQAKAIEEDLGRCISGKPANTAQRHVRRPSVTVKYFKPNDTNLLAVVECVVEVNNVWVLAELIAAQDEKEKKVYLEDINYLA